MIFKKLFFYAIALLLSFTAFAQVGIGTTLPTAVLDINPDTDEVPLRIRPSASVPTGLLKGEFYVDDGDGLLYTYDESRSKWLSVNRNMIGWGRNSNTTSNEYLRQFNGALSSDNGWRMIRDGTITAITVQSNSALTYTVEIRKNDVTTVITSLAVGSAQGGHTNTINVDFNEGDYIQCYLNGTNIQSPQVLIETAWRK